MVLAAILRVHCQYGPCSRGGSAWQPQLDRPQRVRRSMSEPGSDPARAGDRRELRGDLGGFGLMAGGDTHGPRLAHVPHLSHISLYTYSVTLPAGEHHHQRPYPRPRGGLLS